MSLHKAPQPDQLPPAVELLLNQAREQGRVVVLATGVFDVLHQEHLAFLTKAKQAGDVLVVGVESDVRVRQMKGEGRPIFNEEERWQNLTDLEIADAVFILPDTFSKPEDYRQFTHHLRPQVLAVSSHTNYLEWKQLLMAEVGGEVKVVHEHNPAVSTTILLEKGAI